MGKGGATLDDPEAIAAGDPGRMLSLITDTARQLLQGHEIGRAARWHGHASGVVVCGMGGSGVAGDVLRSAFADRVMYPIAVSKGYGLPGFCDRNTVVIAVSYSGDTEETLEAYGEAIGRGCRTLAISSGGRLADLATRSGEAHARVPADVAVPRAALGYLVGAVLGSLDGVGLIEAEAEVTGTAELLEDLAARLGPAQPMRANEAKAVASWLEGRTPVIWGTEGLAEAAALRWKTQLNENAKVPAFHSVLSELDHNEVEGWSRGAGEGHAVVVLRHEGEHPRIADRVAATVEAVSDSGLEVREVWAEGDSPLSRLLSLIMVGDLASTYLAILRGVDPTLVPVLTGLKARLSP